MNIFIDLFATNGTLLFIFSLIIWHWKFMEKIALNYKREYILSLKREKLTKRLDANIFIHRRYKQAPVSCKLDGIQRIADDDTRRIFIYLHFFLYFFWSQVFSSLQFFPFFIIFIHHTWREMVILRELVTIFIFIFHDISKRIHR